MRLNLSLGLHILNSLGTTHYVLIYGYTFHPAGLFSKFYQLLQKIEMLNPNQYDLLIGSDFYALLSNKCSTGFLSTLKYSNVVISTIFYQPDMTCMTPLNTKCIGSDTSSVILITIGINPIV